MCEIKRWRGWWEDCSLGNTPALGPEFNPQQSRMLAIVVRAYNLNTEGAESGAGAHWLGSQPNWRALCSSGDAVF